MAGKGVAANLLEITRALLGVSAYEKKTPVYGTLLEDATVKEIREALGGQIQPLPTTQLRWYLADLERAQFEADAGNLLRASQLYRAFQRDGVISGLLGTRTAGLVRLPKRFYGDPEIAGALKANNGSRSVFDEMFPPSELALLAKDGICLGVGVGELLPVEGRDYPVMQRLDPENLLYRWTENRWYFQSTAGLLAITPGDGHWILHLPGARNAPWNAGLWPAIGRAFINKEHAMSCRSNYSAKLANPARVMEAPLGATDNERENLFKKLLRWGMNQVFTLPVGWTVKILESNGIGIQVFQKEIDASDNEAMVAVCGQVVTVTGGTGFANADIHKTIREDLIKSDGDALAYTINTQGIPMFLAQRYGIDAIQNRFTAVEWNTATPVELKAEADTMMSLASGLEKLAAVLETMGKSQDLDVDTLLTRFAIPMRSAESDTAAVATDDKSGAEAPEFETKTKATALRLLPSASSSMVEELYREWQRVRAYSEDQPRADDGKFGEGPGSARYEHNHRKNRESVKKRLGPKLVSAIEHRDGEPPACQYCHATEGSSGRHLHLDHVIARADGGKDVPENLVHACHTCNSRKKALSLKEWKALNPNMPFTVKSIHKQIAKPLVFEAKEKKAA